MLPGVADIEVEALKKDRRFLVRLVLVMIVGIALGLWVFTKMTSNETQGCAADAVTGVADDGRSE
jgi:hypothetical protein